MTNIGYSQTNHNRANVCSAEKRKKQFVLEDYECFQEGCDEKIVLSSLKLSRKRVSQCHDF